MEAIRALYGVRLKYQPVVAASSAFVVSRHQYNNSLQQLLVDVLEALTTQRVDDVQRAWFSVLAER
jgi:hypothetical protein